MELGVEDWHAAPDHCRAEMRAFVLTGPRECGVQDIDPPIAVPGGVIIDVHRAGVCGTDIEFYIGQMPYLHEGHAQYPMRLGHEWMGYGIGGR